MTVRRVSPSLGVPRSAIRLVIGVAIIVLVTFGGSIIGWLTQGGRVDPAVISALEGEEHVDVVVHVAFKPEAFHLRQMQARGVLGRSTDSTIDIHRVTREDLEMLAVTGWISRVELQD